MIALQVFIGLVLFCLFLVVGLPGLVLVLGRAMDFFGGPKGLALAIVGSLLVAGLAKLGAGGVSERVNLNRREVRPMIRGFDPSRIRQGA